MKTLVSDCLHNCDHQCVENFDTTEINHREPGVTYGRGIINGMVSVLMGELDMTFAEAISYIKSRTTSAGPHGPFDERCVVPAWKEDWRDAPTHQP